MSGCRSVCMRVCMHTCQSARMLWHATGARTHARARGSMCMRPATACFAHLTSCLVGSLSLLPPALIKSPRCVCACVCVCLCVMFVDSQPTAMCAQIARLRAKTLLPSPIPSTPPLFLSLMGSRPRKHIHTPTNTQIQMGSHTHTHTHRSQMGSRPRKIHTTPQPPLRDSAVCT